MPRRTRSSRQEEAAAKRLGGRPVSGSGNGWVTKNDVKTDQVSVEVKYTDKKSYSLKYADLLSAEKNALLDSGRSFAFIIGFGRQLGQGSMQIEREYVVIPREDWEGMLNGHPE